MKKSKINQDKKMIVELMLMHEVVDTIVFINVVARSHNDAKAHALKAVRDQFGLKAESVCEIRNIELVA